MLVARDVFAAIGLVVVLWVVVRVPFWIRAIRREDREAEAQRVAEMVDPLSRYGSIALEIGDFSRVTEPRGHDEATLFEELDAGVVRP